MFPDEYESLKNDSVKVAFGGEHNPDETNSLFWSVLTTYPIQKLRKLLVEENPSAWASKLDGEISQALITLAKKLKMAINVETYGNAESRKFLKGVSGMSG